MNLEDIERIVKEQEHSGKRAGDFCRERGLDPKKFSYWKHKKAKQAPRFVRLDEEESIEIKLPNGLILKVKPAQVAIIVKALLELQDVK